MVQAGMVLAGKYQVERVLGQGGMGCVVSAMHLQLGQRVAIKFLLPEALRIHEAVERFLREARAAVRLRSEHVGRVIDVGQFDDGAPYMVMEFLEGMDLSGCLQRSGTIPIPHAVDYILQACEAIAEAHSIGIVHRDLKPANLFLTRRADGGPLIKVLDFGISKASQGDASFNLTRTTSVMGSPGYMSPEQLRSTKDCDARTDIWALGVILYELATGRTPFGGDSITELALRVAMDPTPAMQLPGVPAGFEQVVARCLAKDPPDRFQNVAELAAALVPFGPPSALEAAMRVARVLQVSPSSLAFGNPSAPTIAVGGGGAPTTLSSAAGTYGQVSPAGRRKVGLVVGVAAAGVAAGVAVVVAMSGGGDGGADRGPAATPEVAPAPEPDRAPTPDPAAARPEPEVAKPEPEVAKPEPEVAKPEPEAAKPEPDVAEPEVASSPDPVASAKTGSREKRDRKSTTKTRKGRAGGERDGGKDGGGEDLSDSRY
jgi:eukaryotic-like serine/threonine-protein kinase